jgi:hypothetical protein
MSAIEIHLDKLKQALHQRAHGVEITAVFFYKDRDIMVQVTDRQNISFLLTLPYKTILCGGGVDTLRVNLNKVLTSEATSAAAAPLSDKSSDTVDTGPPKNIEHYLISKYVANTLSSDQQAKEHLAAQLWKQTKRLHHIFLNSHDVYSIVLCEEMLLAPSNSTLVFETIDPPAHRTKKLRTFMVSLSLEDYLRHAHLSPVDVSVKVLRKITENIRIAQQMLAKTQSEVQQSQDRLHKLLQVVETMQEHTRGNSKVRDVAQNTALHGECAAFGNVMHMHEIYSNCEKLNAALTLIGSSVD